MFLDPVVNLLQTFVSKPEDYPAPVPNVDISWDMLEDAFDTEAIIYGYLDSKVDCGYRVRFGDITGFAPRYRFDLCEYDHIPDTYKQRPIPFVILSMDRHRLQLVVSRIDAVKVLYGEQLESFRKNQILTGRVSCLMDKVVTVDVGGLTCLVPTTEVSWNQTDHPDDVLGTGDEVQVKLLKIIPSKAYLTGSIRQLDSSCWQDFSAEHDVGSVLPVTITNVTDFGYFVSYDNRVTGILHWTELSWQAHNKQQAMQYVRGDELEVSVSDMDYDKQQVSFSLKALTPNPAEQALANYEVGQIVEGVIRTRTDFGLFIEIVDGFNGLLHFSNLSWYSNSKTNLVNFRVGMSVCCQIIDIDRKKGRVALGLKQLVTDPFIRVKQLKPTEGAKPVVSVAVSSCFQANCHNQIVSLLTDIQQKMHQHLSLTVDSVFFDGDVSFDDLPDVLVVLLSDDFFKTEGYALFREVLTLPPESRPMIVPVVVDELQSPELNDVSHLAMLPVDGKHLQQWRVKSAYWTTVNKGLVKTVRHAAGLN